MGYLIGTDEAGYGPNLGPLVISATVWEAPEGVGGEDLFGRLGHLIAPGANGVSAGGPCVAIADSKRLYAPGKGLRDVHTPLEPDDYERLRWLLDATPVEYVTLEYGGRRLGKSGRADEDDHRRNDPEALVEQIQRLAEMLGQALDI